LWFEHAQACPAGERVCFADGPPLVALIEHSAERFASHVRNPLPGTLGPLLRLLPRSACRARVLLVAEHTQAHGVHRPVSGGPETIAAFASHELTEGRGRLLARDGATLGGIAVDGGGSAERFRSAEPQIAPTGGRRHG